jgi:hypothetical protein
MVCNANSRLIEGSLVHSRIASSIRGLSHFVRIIFFKLALGSSASAYIVSTSTSTLLSLSPVAPGLVLNTASVL